MKKALLITALSISVFVINGSAQDRKPVTPATSYVVKTAKDVEDIQRELRKKTGNPSSDIVAQAGNQTRVAVFYDDKRENDMIESHDGSDDYYYVLSGSAVLSLGGTLVDPKEVSPGEWRAKTVTGATKYTIKKGDLVFVPRGTPHQRTSVGKDFTMILVKIFAVQQPTK